MPPVFPLSEYEPRMARAQAAIRERGLAGLLVYAQESMYYLTGYDTAGYVFYQVLVVPAEGSEYNNQRLRPPPADRSRD